MTKSAPNPNKARDRVADRDRATAALALRRDGTTWPDIAAQLDYHDAATAYTAVSRVLARVESETAAEYRMLLTSRYEQLWAETMTALSDARDGREVGRAQLIASGRGVLDSLAKLHGLQSVEPVTVTVERNRDMLDKELLMLTRLMKEHHPSTAGAATPHLDGLIGELEALPGEDADSEDGQHAS